MSYVQKVRNRLVRPAVGGVPPDFDEAAYLVANPDVAAAVASGDIASGRAHYAAFGMSEGRPLAGAPVDRVERVLASIDRDGKGLEVGPSHSPMAPKAAGFDVDVVDHLDTETLRAHFSGLGHALTPNGTSLIEEVDFVWKGEPLPELVGGEDIYDWIISSHSIEHIPDLIGFFQGCRAILRPEGRLALVVPDYRYCFDHYGTATTTVPCSTPTTRAAPSPHPGRSTTTSRAAPPSTGPSRGPRACPTSPSSSTTGARRSRVGPTHRVGPTSRATCTAGGSPQRPSRVVVDDLVGLGLIDLRIVEEHPTHGAEFWVTLAPGAEPAAEDARVEMLRAALRSIAD